MRKFAACLSENIQNRFPQTMLLKAGNLVHLEDYLKEDDLQKLVYFGVENLRIITEHLGCMRPYKTTKKKNDYADAVVRPEEVIRQFSLFKYMLYYNHRGDDQFMAKSLHEKWTMMFSIYKVSTTIIFL